MPARSPTVLPRGATLTDVIILFAAFALLGAGLLPAVAGRSRETADRVKCASNLKQIGLAMLLYQNANGGAYPRTMHDPTTAVTTQYTGWAAPAPFTSAGPADNDVTAALFLLLRTQDIGAEPFVCPAVPDVKPWDFAGGSSLSVSNFPHRGVLSYGYTNPYPTTEAQKAGYRLDNTISAEFAVAADMSPGGAALAMALPTDSAARMKAVNTTNHDGDGQNVMFGDGHVEFLQNPFVGVNRDNIYTAAAGAVLAGQPFATSPIDVNDSVILPTRFDGPAPPLPPSNARVWTWVVAGSLLATLTLAWVFVYLPRRSPGAAAE